MIDYQEIIEQLDDNKVMALLDKLGIPYEDKPDCLIMPTACHNQNMEEASQKLYYYKNTHIFYCYTEDGAMSIFNFLKHFYEIRDIAYDWYTDIYELVLGCSYFGEQEYNPNAYKSIRDNYTLRKERKELPSYPKEVMESFVQYYPIEWLNDGISKEAMDKFGIRFSPSQNKIIIPHYDVGGRLVGIRGRALNEEDTENWGKYMPVQIEGKWYSHPLSLNLYGLNQTKENIKATGIAYIAEGEKSVLQFESFNQLNCTVASCGNKFNKYQLDLLIRTCGVKEVILCYDQEEKQGSQEYFNKLYEICLKYKVYVNMSFIYDKSHLLKLKESPFDKGEETFLALLKTRVKV